jgi:hypothetical protein
VKRTLRYLPVALWILCAALTLLTARSPGFVLHASPVPYREAAANLLPVWIILALEAALLHAIVRSYSWRRAWIRYLACAAGSASSASVAAWLGSIGG